MITRDIRSYVDRDWKAARYAKDHHWADRIERLGPGEGLRIADGLRRQVRQRCPDWPSAEDRQADWAAHANLSERLRRADHARRH